MKTRLVIEQSTRYDEQIRKSFQSAATEIHNNIDIFTNRMRNNLLALKVGRGGSHIWISNNLNERIAIIYF